MAQALMPRYANAQTISFTDERIKGTYVTYDSPGGNSGKMRGYLVQPKGTGPFPSVHGAKAAGNAGRLVASLPAEQTTRVPFRDSCSRIA